MKKYRVWIKAFRLRTLPLALSATTLGSLVAFAEERFRVGTGTALEMQEARNQLYESTSEVISSKFVLIFYSRILDFYMGKDILF